MKYKDFYSHIFEKYDSVGELLSDPNNNNLQLRELLSDFEKHGGKILGEGTYATVLSHPSWKYVLKIFHSDVSYLRFVRFALKNPRKSFPKFFDKPRRIVPNFTRPTSHSHLYIIKTEKLNPITKEEFLDIDFYKSYGGNNDYLEKMKDQNDIWKETYIKIKEIEKLHPSIMEFKKDYWFLITSDKEFGTPDFTRRNIMKRDNGEFVLIDPFWEGENPYQTHDRLLKAEIGYDGDDEEEPEMYKGGGFNVKNKKTKNH